MADSSTPSYASSASAAKGHASNLFKSTIGEHPVTAAVIMGVFLLIILILAFYTNKYKTAADMCVKTTATKSSFGGPEWWHGSGDAGSGGSLHRDTTPTQAAAYMPRAGMASMSPCGMPWDPAATTEAQALSALQALQTTGYAEPNLHSAMTGSNLSDAHLAALLHQGGAP